MAKWFAADGLRDRTDGGVDDGEELEGLLTSDGNCSADCGQSCNPSDAHNENHLPKPPSRRRDEVKSCAARVRDEAAASKRRQVLGHLETIDWSQSRTESRRHDEFVEAKLRNLPAYLRSIVLAYDAIQSWVALGVIGASCGFVASIIDTGTDWATDIKFGLCSRGFWISKETCCSDATDMFSCAAWNEWAPPGFFSFVCYVMIAVCMGSYSAWIARLYPFASGSGLPEIKVIMSGFEMERLFGFGTLLTKSMGLILAVGAGLSIGKEGPFVHVAMCVAHVWAGVFSKYSDNQGRKRELLASAAAAGVAVAFGAPVGGVLFSLEEVSSYFPPKTMWRAFWCAIVAVLTMQHLNQEGMDKVVMFQVHYHHQWRRFELLPFLLLGVLGGLLGAAFNKLHLALLRWRRNTSAYASAPVLEAAFLSFISATIQYQAVYLRGSSTGLLAALFSENCAHTRPADLHHHHRNKVPNISAALCQDEAQYAVILELLMCALIKVPLTLWASTAAVPGGMLIPSLVMGGLVGRATGLLLQLLAQATGDGGFFEDCRKTTECITPGVYAMVGAAAVLAGVTRSTVSLVVIMLEVTGGLEYCLPIMTAVMVSKWIGDVVGGRDTIYDNVIKTRGYPHLDHKLDLQTTLRKGGCARDVLAFIARSVLRAEGEPKRGTPQPLQPLQRLEGKRSVPVLSFGSLYPAATAGGAVGQQADGEEGVGSLHVLEMHGNSQGSLRQVLRTSRCGGFPVVASRAHMVIIGFVTRASLLALLAELEDAPSAVAKEARERSVERGGAGVDVMSVAELAPLQVDQETSIDRLIDMFVALGLRHVLVSSRGLLTGIITKKDLLHYLKPHTDSD